MEYACKHSPLKEYDDAGATGLCWEQLFCVDFSGPSPGKISDHTVSINLLLKYSKHTRIHDSQSCDVVILTRLSEFTGALQCGVSLGFLNLDTQRGMKCLPFRVVTHLACIYADLIWSLFAELELSETCSVLCPRACALCVYSFKSVVPVCLCVPLCCGTVTAAAHGPA